MTLTYVDSPGEQKNLQKAVNLSTIEASANFIVGGNTVPKRNTTAHDPNPFGAWQSWQPHEVAQLFSALAIPWWIAGGWAVDLFLGEQTRDHEDGVFCITPRNGALGFN